MKDRELEIRLAGLAGITFREAFRGKCSEWLEHFLMFHEPGREGRFSFYSREYLREPCDFYTNESTDMVLCFGTRTGKTTTMFGGAAFRAWQRARRILFVKPTTKGTAGAENDARTRFKPLLWASDCLRPLIPTGARRHDFKTAQQILLNGSIVDWTGSNSVANLASNSFEDVNQDEVDKFNATRRKDSDGKTIEANAVDLADERTGEYRLPKRVKSSTPTLPNGRIWVDLGKTDIRRRFIPCPLCGRDHPSSRLVVIAWSEQYTVLPKTFGYGTQYEPGKDIPLAFVTWDKEAKREDETWDLERVEKSAGYLCPHCGGTFKDDDKVWMDRNGVWIPTQKGVPRTEGYHLPSMYSSHEENLVGKMASKFLKELKGIDGPRNFINSKLAEPYGDQETKRQRTEVISEQSSIGEGWVKFLTVDCQQTTPHFWYVVRAWNGGDSELAEADSCDTWAEIASIQERHKILDEAVFIDAGFGRYEDAEVYRNCLEHGTIEDRPGLLPIALGWLPCLGQGGYQKWRDQETGLLLPYRMDAVDPLRGTDKAKSVEMNVLKFAADTFKDRLDTLRKQKSKFKWIVQKTIATDTYWKQMDGEWKPPVARRKKANVAWEKRHRYSDNHLFDCEVLQIVAADFAGRFNEPQTKDESTQTAPDNASQ